MSEPDPVPGPPGGPLTEEPPLQSVGTARMRPDRTIELHLRAETSDGMVGEAMFSYAPDDLQYEGILQHLGALAPGDQCSVPPFA